ncbi:CpsD/CapB family tyrosine-protein kinase [Salisediminibacterium selenitireducens]|uniref:non-specific protein-tyrosine kinase n=1 Tax=Bacillus selenitireducens (strain ATCC 700615 / DSM 15326 / MLS10) TaxID=439292 RepID=D6Y034_BACIE|nr:CpsD/CapB family tyrosine-protein kinase [Salisediminibacterium selenitireducens]ADI00536.1 capsular exopolysaccharide family [[Bacillus] selenitireducens MLS10]
MAFRNPFAKKVEDHLTEKQRSLITHFSPKSPISEQFRAIRTNIQFASPDISLKRLLVTSTSPGEGKSTTAANLAIVLAQQENRVLLIDGDMRKPTGHFTFQLPNKQGLSNVLAKQASLSSCVQESQIEGVSVLTCGPIPPNPAELLGSKQMDTVLQEAEEMYDYIIIDSPPILAVTDAQLLAAKVEGVVLVTSSGKTEREAAKKSKELLDNAHARILGVILNRKDKKETTYYYYYGND